MTNLRANAAIQIARRRLFESLIHPGFYAALAVGLAIAYVLVVGFVHSIDSSGFDYKLNPVYNLIGGILSGAFGSPFTSKVFAGGPFLFALHLAFVPVVLFLAMTSVYRYGTEKSSGAIELLCYGPSDGTSYFLASIIKDLVLTAVVLLVLLVFFWFSGLVTNLAVTAPFLVSLPILLTTAFCVYAYGVLVSVISDSANAGLALFFGVMLFFIVSLVGSQAMVSGYVESITTVAAWTIKWFSPFFYWSIDLRAQASGQLGLFLAALCGQLGLGALVLLGSHFVSKARGVSP